MKRTHQKAENQGEEDLDPPVTIANEQETTNPTESDSPPAGVVPVASNTATIERGTAIERDPLEPSLPHDEHLGRSIYKRFDPGVRKLDGELHDPSNAQHVLDLVNNIARLEAPILFESLYYTVAACWGLQRTGSRVRDVVRQAIDRSGLVVRRIGQRDFIWTKELAESTYEGFRVPDAQEPKPRKAQEISADEFANAAAHVLEQHISMDVEDLARETANIFGIRRLGTNVRAAVDEGIALLKQQDRCREEGSNIIAP